MSDAYGVGNALKAFHHSITLASRATGRTTRMLEQLKDGDRVVLTSENMAQHIRPLLKEMGKDVELVVCPPSNPGKLFERPPSKAYTHFDHDWVDEFYRLALARAGDDLMRLARDTSGDGVAYAEARLTARRLGQYPQEHEFHNVPETYITPRPRREWRS